MATARSDADHDRTEGSTEWFDDHWQRSLEQRRFLYPRAVPATQWELFEREKARHIDLLLNDKRLSVGLVLECGCGTAGMSIYLANHGYTAVAVDLSRKALALARLNTLENSEGDAVSRVHLLEGDVLSLPFGDECCDVVMSHGLLEHFDPPSLRIVLGEMVRVLRPGGLFLADIAHGGFSVRKVARWLNLLVILVYYLCRGDTDKLRITWASYFDGFYENRLDPRQWTHEFELAGLADTEMKVMRPFPPLDLTPSVGKMYVAFMERSLRFWHWFDASQSWLSRKWGWLYLAHAAKPAQPSPPS